MKPSTHDWGKRLGHFKRTEDAEVRVRLKTMELPSGTVVSFVELRQWTRAGSRDRSRWKPTRQRIQIRSGEILETIEMLETALYLLKDDAA